MLSPYQKQGFGENLPSPIGLDPDGDPVEIAELIPPDQQVVINSRDTVEDVSRTINANLDAVAAPLAAVWNKQESFISEGDIRTFGLSQDALNDINQSYSDWVEDDLSDQWLLAGAVGASNVVGIEGGTGGIVNLFPHMEGTVPVPTLPGESAADFIRARELDLVTRMTEAQKIASQELIQEGLSAGLNERVVARQIRPMVGLDAQQAKAIRNLRATLIADEINPDRIEKIIAKRIKRMRLVRSQRIARTEMTWGWNQGQLDAVRAYKEAGWFPSGTLILKKWRKVLPVPECFCDALDGQTVGMETTFPGMTEKVPNVLTPPAHPNCACAIDIVVSRVSIGS
jgi:hypothetical protein